jgi:hypothetical protein
MAAFDPVVANWCEFIRATATVDSKKPAAIAKGRGFLLQLSTGTSVARWKAKKFFWEGYARSGRHLRRSADYLTSDGRVIRISR